MAFDWQHYLVFAQRIKGSPEAFFDISEAAYRAAASRAYYAAFKTALKYSMKFGYQPTNDGNDHVRIQRYLITVKDPEARPREASVQLVRLYDLRRMADYEDTLKNREPKHFASNAITIANLVLEHLQVKLPSSAS